MKRLLSIAVSLAASLVASHAAAASLRCRGTIVRDQLSEAELVALCGEPVYRVEMPRETKETSPDGKEKVTYETEAVYLYGEGAGSFLRAVHLIDDAVSSIEELRLRQGAVGEKPGVCPDDPSRLKTGDGSVLVGFLCGRPASERVVSDEFLPVGDKVHARRVRTEVWTYTSRDHDLRLTIRDGRVAGTQVRKL